MRFLLLSFLMIFIFSGCQNKSALTPEIKKIHSFNNFDYSKEQIDYFENEFDNILAIDNPNILNEYLKFYTKNSSYFLNGKIKKEKLQRKISELLNKKNETSKDEKSIKEKRELVEQYKISHPKKALKILEELVEQEDIKSMKDYASANIYMVRPVIVQDLQKALETYEKLAELGELSALMRLGNFYEYGYHKSVAPKDKEKSLEYYEEAASKGYILAKKKLYEIYSCEKCKPNRYDEEKALKLKEELLEQVNQKISTVLKKKSVKKSKPLAVKKVEPKKIKEVKKAPKVEETKKSEVAVTSRKKKNTLKKLATVKCYDMNIASITLSVQCKRDIREALKNHKKLSKIDITPILDKDDKAFFAKKVASKTLQESLLKSLGYERSIDAVWYLQRKLKDDSILNISTYYVDSKKSNRGVVIKFY